MPKKKPILAVVRCGGMFVGDNSNCLSNIVLSTSLARIYTNLENAERMAKMSGGVVVELR